SVARPDLSWTRVLLSMIALTGGYLGKLIWPFHLSAFHVFHESRQLSDAGVIAGLAGLFVCVNLFAWLWHRGHAASFALLWMGTTRMPELNATWVPAAVFSDRYLYLAFA